MRWLRWTAGILLGMLLLIVVTLPLIKEPVLNRALQKINTQSDYQLEIEHGSLTLLTSFPQLGIRFKGASIQKESDDPFLRAEEIVVYTDLIQMIGGTYELKSFYLKSASLELVRFADGSTNFSVRDDGSGNPVSLSWKNARIEDLKVLYRDKSRAQDYSFLVGRAKMDGSLQDDILSIDTKVKGIINRLKADDDWKWNDMAFELEGTYQWNQSSDEQDFSVPELVLGNTNWNVAGIIREGKEGLYDFRCKGQSLQLEAVCSLLPPHWEQALEGMTVQGMTDAELHIFGSTYGSNHHEPEVELDFELSDGRYRSEYVPGTLSGITATGSYEYRPGRIARLSVDHVQGGLEGSPFSGTLSLDHSNKTLLSGRIEQAECPVSLINRFIPDSSCVIEKGEIVVRDIRFDELDVAQPNWTELTAQVSGNGLEGHWKDSSWQIRDLALDWGPDSIRLHHASGQFLEDRWQLRGRIAMPEYLDDFTPSGRAELFIDHLQLDRWVAFFSGRKSPMWKPVAIDSDKEHTWYGAVPAAHLNLSAEIDSLHYGEIRAGNIQWSGRWKKQVVDFETALQTSEGRMECTGDLSLQSPPKLHLEGIFQSVDIHKLFDQWQNFGQNLVEDRHLRGTMDARFLVNAHWRTDGGFASDQMEVISGIQLFDGELIGLELLEDFSSYIHTEDLRHIHFQNIRNILILRNGAVYIPAMFIQSNAANLTVNGIHKLDQTVDYNIKLNAGQVMTRRILKGRDGTEVVPAKRDGWFNMYYTVYGHPEQLQYKTDRNKVQGSFSHCDQIKDRARERLIDAFGEVPLFEEPVDWEAIPEYEGVEGEDPVYLDNF